MDKKNTVMGLKFGDPLEHTWNEQPPMRQGQTIVILNLLSLADPGGFMDFQRNPLGDH